MLMRHGKPLLSAGGWVALAGMPAWIAAYDLAQIVDEPIPPASLAAAGAAATIVASPLPRALASVGALGHTPAEVDAMFREAALPTPSMPAWCRFARLPPALWAVLLRLMWMAGYANGVESRRATRLRAREAAARLIALAQAGPVVLVAHGIINSMIARELRRSGWARRQPARHACWSVNSFTLAAACSTVMSAHDGAA
ncbi:histidine phosphatase family protein [Massilia sp. CCM 8733]|uniref:Histidine phosphatase family protein n=1 Tax=Massilia mucilaginosa TaxID=2609282 RepID=A0ABX0NKX3_9BURK|nr:histidine phosphatase family protein [Massilia mucilaginosa]NHZ87448.1 histidine phosphatase family protein [Massilia mucilaginosa]